MKNIVKLIIVALTFGAIFWSCKKDNLNTTELQIENKEFVGGVIEDPIIDPAPTKEFMLHGSRKVMTVNSVTSTGDVTAPVCDIITPTPGQLMPNGPSTWTITVTASDEGGGSGLDRTEMYVYNDGYEYKLPNTTAVQLSWTFTPQVFQYSASSVLLLYAYDKAGNGGARSIGVYRTQNLTPTPLPAGFPSSFTMITPPVISQGQEQSTVSIATAYNQFSIEKYYKKGSTSWSNSTNVMSPEMVYNAVHVGGTTCGGSSLGSNYGYLSSNGTCTWSSLPYSNTNGCSSTLITNQMISQAKQNKTAYDIRKNFVYLLDRGMTKIYLNNKRPLVFVARMENTAYNSGAGFIWKTSDGSNIGSTALTIVGFDDSKRAFKCMTTWGTGKCDGGFLWIDYDFITQVGFQAWYLDAL